MKTRKNREEEIIARGFSFSMAIETIYCKILSLSLPFEDSFAYSVCEWWWEQSRFMFDCYFALPQIFTGNKQQQQLDCV